MLGSLAVHSGLSIATAMIVRCDNEEVLNIAIYSPFPSKYCRSEQLSTENVTYCALVLQAPDVDV